MEFLKKYHVSLINKRVSGARLHANVKITYKGKSIIVKDFSCSYWCKDPISEAFSFIIAVSTEWIQDLKPCHENDDPLDEDNKFFKDMYDQVKEIIPDYDIDELNLYFYDLKNRVILTKNTV